MDEEIYLIDTRGVNIADGRYAVFGDDGELAAQGDDLDAAMAAAWAKGVKAPALIDLELTQDNHSIIMNSAVYSMKVLQSSMTGEAEKAGFRLEQDVTDVVMQMRVDA